jgi:hypothetical protein
MVRLLLAPVALIVLLVLLLPVFIVVGLLLLFASAVRRLANILEPDHVPWSDIMAFDSVLGWKPRSGLDTHYLATGDDVFHVVTDEEGWSGTRSVEESRVVVVGDSFAFGYGVNPGRSFADLDPSLPIKGIGAPGYSLVQGVLLMEQLAPRLAGKLVVWFICLENDLQDSVMPWTWRYRMPFARVSPRTGAWEIVGDHVRPTPWQSPDASWRRILPHLFVPGPLADRVFAGCDYLIGRGAEACRQAGAHLVVVTIPDPVQLTDHGRATVATLSGRPDACDVNLPDHSIAESCARYGVPLVIGKDHLSVRDYKSREALHWNEQGHRRMADVLGRVYESFKSGNVNGAPVPTSQSPITSARSRATA